MWAWVVTPLHLHNYTPLHLHNTHRYTYTIYTLFTREKDRLSLRNMRGMSLAPDAIDFFFLLRCIVSLSVAFLYQLATQYHMDHKSFVRSEFLR